MPRSLGEISEPSTWLGEAGRERMARGTPRQRRALRALARGDVLDALAPWEPTIVGTFPIRLDVETSDVDLVCRTRNVDEFQAALVAAFGRHPEFRTWRRPYRDADAAVALFLSDGLWVEAFGADDPVEAQSAFRHMVVEARMLALAGERAHRAIRRLKRRGLKTEPAFGRWFRLPGDPYLTLLDLADLDDGDLELVVRAAGRSDPSR